MDQWASKDIVAGTDGVYAFSGIKPSAFVPVALK
jgi:hypothetical protein